MKIFLTSIAANVIEKASPYFSKPAKNCKVVCIPTAANVETGPKEWLASELAEFERLGYVLNMFDIDGASLQDVDERFSDADIIYVTGGNSFYLLEKMQACGFEKAVRKALSKGAVYIGSSAGSVVCSPDINYVRDMDEPHKANLSDTTGLGLIDFFVMVHMDHPSFTNEANKKFLELTSQKISVVPLKDNQGLFIDGTSKSIINA